MLFIHRFCQVVVLGFLGRQVSEQLTDGGVAGPGDGSLIKIAGLVLHDFHFPANHRNSEDRIHPERFSCDEPFHVLAANERDMLPKAFLIQLDQAVPVTVLLVVHGLQGFGRLRKIGAHARGEVGVDSAILFFVLDGQREHFLRGEVFDRFFLHR